MRASVADGGRSLSQYSQFGRSCRAIMVSRDSIFAGNDRRRGLKREGRISLDFSQAPLFSSSSPRERGEGEDQARSGSFVLSFSRSSTIDERTCATLWCGISTL